MHYTNPTLINLLTTMQIVKAIKSLVPSIELTMMRIELLT